MPIERKKKGNDKFWGSLNLNWRYVAHDYDLIDGSIHLTHLLGEFIATSKKIPSPKKNS